MKVLETERLSLRWLAVEDAGFILRLVNEPAWKRHIGDYGVNTLEDAREYIRKGPISMYSREGFGLYLVEFKATGDSIGICGLIKRASLEDVDIGFALLEEFRGKGYAFEAASAVLAFGLRALHIVRVVAISSMNNVPSARLLERLGFRFERAIRLKPDADEVNLYAVSPMDLDSTAKLQAP